MLRSTPPAFQIGVAHILSADIAGCIVSANHAPGENLSAATGFQFTLADGFLACFR
jgi:hypothetical protein